MSIERKMQHAMTVSDLIEELKNYDEDALVFFGTDYGDHCHTEQALPVQIVGGMETSNGYPATVEKSAYSHSGLAVKEFDPGDYEDGMNPVQQEVVILR